jgi:hypothetical protein
MGVSTCLSDCEKDASDVGPDAGKVTGGRKVPFENKAIRQFGEELAENELAHVRFYRKTLGSQAVSRPTIDFDAGFAAAAKGAGLPDFDPFANEMGFLLGGMLFEDVGVTAYAGAASLIKNKEFLDAAARILAVEAYHMGMARSHLYEMGDKAHKAANAISTARDKLDGPDDKDQGIVRNGKANFVPNNENGMVFQGAMSCPSGISITLRTRSRKGSLLSRCAPRPYGYTPRSGQC